jgi:hypothetical protein
MILQRTFFHFRTWFFCLSPNRTRTSSRVGFRCPPIPSSIRPCSAQDNTLSLNSTVLHRLALEGVAAGKGTQRGATAIGCLRGPGRCLTVIGERLSGVRGVLAVGCKEACEKIAARSSTGCVELDVCSSMMDSRIFLTSCRYRVVGDTAAVRPLFS